MQGATFNGCLFFRANLQSAMAQGAKFINCYLKEADLSGVDFTSAKLINSSFQRANLQRVQFGYSGMILYPGVGNIQQYYTNIEGSDFDGADLRESKLIQNIERLQTCRNR